MSKPAAPAPRFLLLDARAKSGDPSNATVMDTAASEAEAIEAGRTAWKDTDGIWQEVEYKQGELHPIRLRWDLPPAGGRTEDG